MTIQPPNGRLLSFAEACEYLGMPAARLRRLVHARKIPVLRDGRLGFYERDLDEWMVDRRTPADGGRHEPDDRRAAARTNTKPAWMALMPAKRRFPRAS